MQDKQKVFIVEDETFNISILVDILKPKYHLSVAKDGASALIKIGRTMPDIVLLDVMLPGMDGYSVCERLKSDEKTRSIPIIFMTAKNKPEDIVRGLALGAADYVGKPINYMELLSRIKTHLRLAGDIAELERINGEINTLSGILPICPNCHNVRSDDGYWSKVDHYLSRVSSIEFTHGICPDCMNSLYPELKGRTEDIIPALPEPEVYHEEKPEILIIEDENFNISVLSEMLKDEYKLVVARDGRQGLNLLAEHKPDLILLDILMTGMDGYQVCQKIKANETYRGIPVLFMTVKRETDDIIRAFQTGAVDYITKPINYDELQARVRTHITIRKTIQKLKNAHREYEALYSLLPICSNCHKIRSDKGYWQTVEDYVSARSSLRFKESFCPDCREKMGVGAISQPKLP